MPLAPREVGAILLAGGESRRFGREKARARWRGRRLIDHVLSGLPAEHGPTLLVLRAEQDGEDWPVDRIVHDDAGLPAGPLRGVIGGLGAAGPKWNWVIACDMPTVRAEFLEAMVRVVGEDDVAVIPRWGGRLQPLCALYSRDVVASLVAAVEAGERSLIAALAAVPTRVLDEDHCRRFDPAGASFLNVNHPATLDDLEDVS